MERDKKEVSKKRKNTEAVCQVPLPSTPHTHTLYVSWLRPFLFSMHCIIFFLHCALIVLIVLSVCFFISLNGFMLLPSFVLVFRASCPISL